MKKQSFLDSLFPTPHVAEQLSTANSAADMRLSGMMSANAASIAAIPDGEWGLIAPFGDHPSPDGRYIQHFDRAQSDKMVENWNSFTGKCARIFKNMVHGLGVKHSAPVWEGHPDDDPARFPVSRLLAEVEDIRTANVGIEGKLKWNPKGMESRARGPLYPTVYWFHNPPSGDPLTVFPELLASVGLWPDVNIPGVPAWTSNAALTDVADEAQSTANQTTQDMTPEELAALRKSLGLGETASVALCITTAATANAAALKLTEREGALTTANAAKQTLETQLSTANSKVTGLTTEVETLRTGLLDLAEKKGVITPAERTDFATRISTANTATAAITELQTRKPALPTKTVELNGNRVDLSTANARSSALETAIAKRMESDKCDRGVAYDRVQADPAYAQLFAAMKPAAAAAA